MFLRVTTYIIFMIVSFLVTGSVARSEPAWSLNNISEAQVNEIAKNIFSSFELEINQLKAPLEYSYKHSDYGPTPLVSSAELKIKERWDEASKSSKPYYLLELLGVFTRVSTMTKDGVALIICHELGHALGGEPRFLQIYPGLDTALSAEGQADYFAATSCFRKYALLTKKQSNSPQDIDLTVKNKCLSKYKLAQEKVEICERTAMAGAVVLRSLNEVRSRLGKELMFFDFNWPSKWNQKELGQTELSHPDFQCRLDTYLNGALCESEAGCETGDGQRPSCWFVK